MKIRAITIYLNPKSWEHVSLREYIERVASSLHEALEAVEPKLDVWSLRLTITSPPSEADMVKVAENVYDASTDSGINFVSGFTLEPNGLKPTLLRQLLECGVYVCIKMGFREDFEKVSEALVKTAYRDPLLLTKVAVMFGRFEGFLTPYFPLSVNTRFKEGLAVALLYPTELLNAYREGGLNELTFKASRLIAEAEALGKTVSSRLGVEFYGVDYSVSPWMENSSARLVEEVSGVPIPEPGSPAAVAKLNRATWEAASKACVKVTGFCELMLPVAEDDVLKQRGLEGRLRLRDLVAMSVFCVAGVDMAVIPAENARRVVEGLLKDVSQASRLKNKVLGVRVIPYPGVEPGSSIDLGWFGKTPVLFP